MTYPQDLLSPGESVVLEFGSHWSALWRELLATIAYIALLILLVPDDVKGWAITIITVAWLWTAVGGYIRWRTGQHLITTERFIVRSGMIRKIGQEFRLGAINDVTFRQNPIERALDVGELLIESSGSNGQDRVASIPKPAEITDLINETRRSRAHSVARMPAVPVAPPPPESPSSRSSAEQLEILGRLFDQGKLTQSEYDSEKRKLLG
jgi:uncharacterized membrane protein YdbT with pleckstrin-like domain